MKIAFKYLMLLSLLLINTSCKKEGIVEPSTTDLPLITNFAPVILTTSSVVLSGKIDLRGSDSASIYFEYGLSNSYGLRTPVQKIYSSGAFSARVINLNPETFYHWRIYCKTTDVVTGNDTTFVTILQPIVNSLPLENLTLTSATLIGQIDLQGRDSVSLYFEYGLTTSYGSRSPEQFITTSGIFSSTINNLKPATTYHWRIYCKPHDGNSDITTWDSTFTTFFLPSITSLTISNLTITSVILGGQIDLHGRASASFYFEYGPTASYGSKSPEQNINSSGIFNFALNNLNKNTTYHWRIYCKTNDGDTSSSDNTFKTFFMPTITDLSPYLTNTSVNISGKIDLHGRSNAYVYFEYGQTTSYGSKSPELNITSSGTFNITINNLTPATIYHARVYCKTTDGDITGDDYGFSTLVEFIYPLNIGKTWTYNYSMDVGFRGWGHDSSEVRNGIRIWKVVSSTSIGDSIIYNLACTARDTIFRIVQNTPTDTSYEEKLIPFTIVVHPYVINVHFENTVRFGVDLISITRFVDPGTTQIRHGPYLYLNGTGFYGYLNGWEQNTYIQWESMFLLQ
jgi:hypothetical protein